MVCKYTNMSGTFTLSMHVVMNPRSFCNSKVLGVILTNWIAGSLFPLFGVAALVSAVLHFITWGLGLDQSATIPGINIPVSNAVTYMQVLAVAGHIWFVWWAWLMGQANNAIAIMLALSMRPFKSTKDIVWCVVVFTALFFMWDEYSTLLARPHKLPCGRCMNASYLCTVYAVNRFKCPLDVWKANGQCGDGSNHVAVNGKERTVIISIPKQHGTKHRVAETQPKSKLMDPGVFNVLKTSIKDDWEMAHHMFHKRNFYVMTNKVGVFYVDDSVCALPKWKNHDSVTQRVGPNSVFQYDVEFYNEATEQFESQDVRSFFESQPVSKTVETFTLDRPIVVKSAQDVWFWNIGDIDTPRYVIAWSLASYTSPTTVEEYLQDHKERDSSDPECEFDLRDPKSNCKKFKVGEYDPACTTGIVSMIKKLGNERQTHATADDDTDTINQLLSAENCPEVQKELFWIVAFIVLALLYHEMPKAKDQFDCDHVFTPPSLIVHLPIFGVLHNIITAEFLKDIPGLEFGLACNEQVVVNLVAISAFFTLEIVFSTGSSIQMMISKMQFFSIVFFGIMMKILGADLTAEFYFDLFLHSCAVGVALLAFFLSSLGHVDHCVWWSQLYVQRDLCGTVASTCLWGLVLIMWTVWGYLTWNARLFKTPEFCSVLIVRLVFYVLFTLFENVGQRFSPLQLEDAKPNISYDNPLWSRLVPWFWTCFYPSTSTSTTGGVAGTAPTTKSNDLHTAIAVIAMSGAVICVCFTMQMTSPTANWIGSATSWFSHIFFVVGFINACMLKNQGWVAFMSNPFWCILFAVIAFVMALLYQAEKTFQGYFGTGSDAASNKMCGLHWQDFQHKFKNFFPCLLSFFVLVASYLMPLIAAMTRVLRDKINGSMIRVPVQ